MIVPWKHCSAARVASVSVVVALAGAACRDTDPPPTHYRDLGTDGTLLLPVSPPPYAISKVQNARADWYPFTEPSEMEAEARPGDDEDEAWKTEVEAEIRELIEQYNETASDRNVEDLLEYHVSEQSEALKPLLETSFSIAAKVTELGDGLREKLPDAADRIAGALAGFGDPSGDVFVVESLSVVSDTEVTAKLPGGGLSPTCRFVVVEDEWYIDMAGVDTERTKPALDAALAGFDGWLQKLTSGELTAEDVLVQIEAAAARSSDMGSAETD